MPALRDRLAAALAPRYLVDEALAAGGMGQVFLGHDPRLGREVAIKVLPPERATAVAVERFLREARLLARLAHPNIVTILDAEQQGELLWFVMPRIRGETLATRLARGPLSPREFRQLGRGLLRALAHAHAHGVIHRDVKPANIFLDDGHALLADFGVALFRTGDDDTLTDTDQLVGTMRYMAPEQQDGEATVQSDLFAAGVTLFEAATGRRWTPAELQSAQWRNLPRRTRTALRHALEPDPARRWADATAFRRALEPARGVPVAGIIGAGAVVLTLLAFLATRPPATAATPPTDRAALVVLPFGSADSTGVQLARLSSLPIEFSAIRILPFLRSARLSVDSARTIAAATVTGAIDRRDPGAPALDVQVYDSAGAVLEAIRIPGETRDLASWGRAVADSLVARLFPTQLTEFRQLAGLHPNRLALEAYIEGQRLFQGGHWSDAETRAATAERLDSSLVQATWLKLIARQWQSLPFKDELDRLAARTTPMPEPLGRLLQAQTEPDLDHRLALYDSLAREYPGYPMARWMAANELFSRGPLAGHPLQEGIAAFRDAAREIPELDAANTYTQTVWGAVRLGDEPLARAELARRHGAPDDPWNNLLWLAVNGRFRRWLAVPARQWLLWRVDTATVTTLKRAVRMGLGVDDPWDQEVIARYLERHATTDRDRANALAARATAMLLNGKPLAALQALDQGAALGPHPGGYAIQPAEWRVLLPILPGAPIPLADSEREAGRRRLRSVAPNDSLWARAAWALALDADAAGHASTRDSLIALLGARATTPWIDELHTYAVAITVGSGGAPDSALALTDRIRRLPPDELEPLRGPLVRAIVYLYRGSWARAKGDVAGAERAWLWHENNDLAAKPWGEPEQGEIDAALSGIARLLRAENLPALDRQDDACRLLDRVTTLWREAEPAMAALRDRAQQERRRCRG